MDTMDNRSNYCSILKKRKSSYKENVTVKIKRHSLKNNEINENDNFKTNLNEKSNLDSMCLICRSISESFNNQNNTCTLATQTTQKHQSKHEHEIKVRPSQNYCKNCVLKTNSKILSDTSPSYNKWNALEIVNQKSQSQWNATSVSSPNSWSKRSSCSSNGRSRLPSYELESTSSTSIYPTVTKTLSSLSSSSSAVRKTKASLSTSSPSPSTGPFSSCSSSLFLSPSTSSTMETSLSLSTAASSQLSSSCSNNGNCMDISTITSTGTENSTSLCDISKNCANVRVTNLSVLRTFVLMTIILEKCFAGMFGTRQRMSQDKKIDSVNVRQSIKQSNYYFSALMKRNVTQKYPIVLMFLVFAIMTLIVPTANAASGDVKLQRNETVCKSRDIRNDVSAFKDLENCTVIEGFLLISLINAKNPSEYENYSYPLLTEITEFVIIYRAYNLRTLSTLFPNLSVIRGKALFEGFALVIYENTHLEDVGLISLTTIARGAVRIEKNPALCFVETIDWTQIAVNMTSDQHFFRQNKAKKECPVCPGEQQKNNDFPDVNLKTCPLHQGQRFCWNSTHCQKICPQDCKNNCNDFQVCCDPGCIGGCSNDNKKSCTSCRHFVKTDTCIEKCPANFFSYLERRCVTAETCRNVIGTKLEGTKQQSLVPFDGACSVRCPPGHTKGNATCEKCVGKCVKNCEGGLIDSVGAAKQMHGCTRIVNNPLSISIKRGGRHLMEELELGLSAIEEIDMYLKVHRTYGMVSLAFFKSLKRIKGNQLESDKFALYVLENQDLETIWGPNQKVQIDRGRVFFHFNPKLCYSIIDQLRPSLLNKSPFDKNEVATDSNGSKGACNTETLEVELVKASSITAIVQIKNPMKFDDDRAFIGYQFFYTEDPYKNVSIFGHRPCDDSWSSEDPSKDIEHIFSGLKPFTQYAYYVKTHTISSESRNGQSKIMYFRTKPDQPKMVQNLKAISNSSSEIIVSWNRPTITNGNLTKYIIRRTYYVNDEAKLESRNYCNDPLKEAATGVEPPPIKADQGTISTNGNGQDCKCDKIPPRKEGSNPQMEEAIYEHVIDFENNIQNFVFVKQTNESMIYDLFSKQSNDSFLNAVHNKSHTNQILYDTLQKRRRRALNSIEYQGNTKPFLTQNINSTEIREFTVNANVTEFVLKDLKHFSMYTISVQACRAPEIGADQKECSPESIAYARTQKLDNVDKARNVRVLLEQSNTTRGNLRIKWDPPERPNSMVVSYTIYYVIANSEDAVIEKRCITELDYRHRFTNGYLITGLPTGNYSIQVQANSLAGEGNKTEPYYIYIPPSRITWQSIVYICVGVLIFVCLVTAAVCYVRKKYLAPPSDLKIFPTVNPYYISMQYLPDEWEVPRDKIIQLGALGQGSFGMVYEGILKNYNNQEDTPCAIKTVNENATDRERLNFLKEASVMKQFNTHHVVRLLGVCSRGQPALVIMELMKNGDLKAYLRQHRPDAEPMDHGEPPMRPPTLERIYQIAIEIADGMAYLAAKKYVHRDLAARNCMVAADLTVKIGDFGMTRDVYETDYYRKGTKGLLPVRWMSPESLKDGVFSSASDVFSYGVVLWEMATLASQPYQGLSNDQVLRFVIDGGVMERPENCPDKLYKVMQKCWQHRPSARPTFMEIIRFLLDSADPKFQEVSFYHSAEAKDMHDQMHPEHDMDDVTTPLRVGEFGFKLESPALGDEEDEDENDGHSPYSLGSAILISSTPGNNSKLSPIIIMNQSNPSQSLPSTSAAAIAAATVNTPFAESSIENNEYIQSDASYTFNDDSQQPLDQQNITIEDDVKKNVPQQSSTVTSKYPNSLKRAVASTVQNVSNNLAPLRKPNLNFLQRRLFKNSSNNQKGSGGKGSKPSDQSNKNGNNNNSNITSMASNAEMGSAGSRTFFSGLTPSHTSKNPNYKILDESINVSATQDDPQLQNSSQTMQRSRTGSCSSLGSESSKNHISSATNQQRQEPHQTTEQCNLNKDNSNLSNSRKIKDTKSLQSQNQNQPTVSSSAHELKLSSGVDSPISIKDNKDISDASTLITTSTKPPPKITKTPNQLKEKWLKQLPPNGFVGREG